MSTSTDAEDAEPNVAGDGSKRALFQRWTGSVRQYVSGSLFKYVQFINRDGDIEWGSPIQKVVCRQCNIPIEEQQEYWNESGSEVVLEVLKRKRQAVAMSMKTRFGRKFIC